ncbi:MAG: pyrroline-5-carboxylate reductase [Acidaminococcaceae bacterium]|nr:pyrroline-5-carboxylate reductase [Acidaminococcaceae bacterium]
MGKIGALAFIGGGAMGEAILKGILAAELAGASEITVSDMSTARRAYLKEHYGVKVTGDNIEAVRNAETVILAVKPQVAGNAITQEVAQEIPEQAAVISIMGSVDLAKLQCLIPNRAVIRVMPNTPLAVGAGMTAIAPGKAATPEMVSKAEAIFASCGQVVQVQESLMEAVTAVSGCGPGYVFMLIDALADAGVNAGLPRDLAIRLAAQTFAGAGKMAVETGLHPAQLRDQVTSPGGTTIAGIHALESKGVRGAFFNAVMAVLERSEKLKGR